MSISFKTTAVAVAIFCLSQAAMAATTTYADQASFDAAVGTSITDDYENSGYTLVQSNADMSAVLGETSYTSTGFLPSEINLVTSSSGNNYYCAGCNGSFTLDFTSTSVGTSDGVYGVSFDFFNQRNPFYTAFVTYGDGSTENIQLDEVDFPAFGFFGFTSDVMISSIAFGLADGGTTGSGSFGLDNLTIANMAPVPVPAAGLLLLGALGGLGALRRRAKSRA